MATTVAGGKYGYPMDARLERVAGSLRLRDRDVGKLWKTFLRFDVDGSGKLSVQELLGLIGESDCLYVRNVFRIVDAKTCGALEFSEFVHAISTYCLFGLHDVLKFCFFTFDKNMDGFIDHAELRSLVKMLYQEKNRYSNVAKALEMYSKGHDGFIDFEAFKRINEIHPMLLYPAFRLQLKLQTRTMSRSWWIRKRRELLRRKALDSAIEQGTDSNYSSAHEYHLGEPEEANRALVPLWRKWLNTLGSSTRRSLGLDETSSSANSISNASSLHDESKSEEEEYDSDATIDEEQLVRSQETKPGKLSKRLTLLRQWSSRFRDLMNNNDDDDDDNDF